MADLRVGARSDPLREAPIVGHNGPEGFIVTLPTRTRKFVLHLSREEALQLYGDLESRLGVTVSGMDRIFPETSSG